VNTVGVANYQPVSLCLTNQLIEDQITNYLTK